MCHSTGWQMLHGGTGGTRRKVWTKILSPNIRYFVAKLRFVAMYALFWNLCTKKCLFWSKTVLLWQKVHYYMVYIAYYTDLNWQTCNYAQKRRICWENGKYALDQSFYDHFCPRRKAANFCHLGRGCSCGCGGCKAKRYHFLQVEWIIPIIHLNYDISAICRFAWWLHNSHWVLSKILTSYNYVVPISTRSREGAK